jgi:hypothetical protein
MIEVLRTIEGNPDPEVLIVWYGGLVGGLQGSLVDNLFYEKAEPIPNASLTYLGVFQDKSSYWRCEKTRCVVFYAEVILGRFYVGELFEVDERSIFENDYQAAYKFCPVSIHSSSKNYDGFVLSKCAGDTQFTLYEFYYTEVSLNLFPVVLPTFFRGLADIKMTSGITPVLYAQGMGYYYELVKSLGDQDF